MDNERDEYRESYRSVWKALELLDGLLTEPQRKAIMREATRNAKKKEQFWLVVTFVPLIVVAWLLQGYLSSTTPYAYGVYPSVFLVYLAGSYIRVKTSRITQIGREAMVILARKRIRPPYCLACEAKIEQNASEYCVECKSVLIPETQYEP
ncbi:MAG: hypothetical protein AAF711_18180 [Planctomycetota bacterium]